MKKTWKKINSKVVYKHPYWQVKKDLVIKPDGNKGYYYQVDVRDFVAVIPLTKDKKSVYLIRQFRYPAQKNSWEIPEGILNSKEKPLAAAKREMEEETGFKASKWQKIGKAAIANGLTSEKFYIFVAQDLKPGVQKLEGGESDIIFKKFSLKKIEEMIRKGQIDDSPTIVSFYLLKMNFNKL